MASSPRAGGAELHRSVGAFGNPVADACVVAVASCERHGARPSTEILSKWVGESEHNLRDLFDRAASHAPAIVFIDEIDAIGFDRSKAVQAHHVGPLTQLLGLLDGFRPLQGVAVLAATNRPGQLDSALVRPGRFDRVVKIPLPELEGRLAILRVHTDKMPLAGDVDLSELAKATTEFTGADLRGLCQEAALAALRTRHDTVDVESIRIGRDCFLVALSSLAQRKTGKDSSPS